MILKRPLASTSDDGTLIRDGGLDGNIQVLVAQYEYTPALGEVRGYSYGGRAHVWITSDVRVGATGLSEETGKADRKVLGGDVHVRLGKNSWAEVESARSDGPGFGNSSSINGGLTIVDTGTAGVEGREAWAHRARAHADLEDLGTGMKGHAAAYYEWRGAGFSSIGYDTPNRQRTFGLDARIEARADLRYLIAYKDYHDSTGRSKQVGDAAVEYDWDKNWAVAFGAKHTEVGSGTLNTTDGGRTDIGAKLTHKWDEKHKAYVFGQVTVSNTGNVGRNDRVGVGGEMLITEKVSVGGEVSYGSREWGGAALVSYEPTADDRYHFGYKLDPDRAIGASTTLNGHDLGGIVIGAKHKYSEQLAAFAENNYDMFGYRRSLTSTYGVVYTPTALWTVNGAVEYGEVQDPFADSLDRIALSGSVIYKDPESVSWRLKGEVRFEDAADPAKDRDTYLISTGTTVKYDENWRLLASFDGAFSQSNQASFLDGDYVKGSFGYAYRGTDRDDVNALFKYIFLYDLPGPDQINSQGLKLGPAQRSHIVSIDANFDVTEHLTIGAKYGARFGEVSQSRSAKDFVASSAHLGVIRADLHIVKNWDALIEARVLHTPEIDTTRVGLVAGVYRHIGENMKLGVGYNFGRFSDDVADLTQNERGVFVNMVGKF